MIRGYLETSEVAQQLGITTEAVLKLTHRGTLKSQFLAGRRLFDPADVAALQADPQYAKRSRKGTQPKKDQQTPCLDCGTSREPAGPGSPQTGEREGTAELKAKE